MRSLWNRLPNVLQGALYGFSIVVIAILTVPLFVLFGQWWFSLFFS